MKVNITGLAFKGSDGSDLDRIFFVKDQGSVLPIQSHRDMFIGTKSFPTKFPDLTIHVCLKRKDGFHISFHILIYLLFILRDNI